MFDRILNTPHFSCNHENSSFRKLAEKTCPNTEFFLVRIVLYSVRIQLESRRDGYTELTAIIIVTSLHRKWSLPLRISSVNVTKSADDLGLFFVYVKKNPLKMLSKMKLLSHKLGWYSFKMFNPDHYILAIYCVSVEYLITTSKTELDN